MINKKNLLGKQPFDLGIKDAIHTAIVSVRAARPLQPGQRCGLNEHGEAVPDKNGPGVADPFLKSPILLGQAFWLLLNQDSVPNVMHVWEHPEISFAPPKREVQYNRILQRYADSFGVTYAQLIEAGRDIVRFNNVVSYPGTKTREELAGAFEDFDEYEFWREWAGEVLHDFPNGGTECCPEYFYPSGYLFRSPAV